MDELAIIPKSMPTTCEGNAKNGPPANGMGITNVNDEDSGANLVGLQKACQLLYLGTHSTKLATTMLLMNICIVYGVNKNL
jgi:hypothetical protein